MAMAFTFGSSLISSSITMLLLVLLIINAASSCMGSRRLPEKPESVATSPRMILEDVVDPVASPAGTESPVEAKPTGPDENKMAKSEAKVEVKWFHIPIFFGPPILFPFPTDPRLPVPGVPVVPVPFPTIPPKPKPKPKPTYPSLPYPPFHFPDPDSIHNKGIFSPHN